MKAAIDGFLELHLPMLPVMASEESYTIDKNAPSGTPPKAKGCSTLL